MKITQEKKNEVVICRIEGEIDFNTSPQLRKVFDSFIRENVKKVALDFSKVSYIDSSGLATLIELLQKFKKIESKFRIFGMNQKVKNIFEVTKVYKIFEIFDDEDTALKDF
ncbi:MAG: STAS domain-containing protein [Candidatus Aenigmatarchaeota archaeon]